MRHTPSATRDRGRGADARRSSPTRWRSMRAAMVMAHNHPSGDPTPSEADRALTRRLARALDALDMRLLDHLVLAGDGSPAFARWACYDACGSRLGTGLIAPARAADPPPGTSRDSRRPMACRHRDQLIADRRELAFEQRGRRAVILRRPVGVDDDHLPVGLAATGASATGIRRAARSHDTCGPSAPGRSWRRAAWDRRARRASR